ncbi:unnamed protein product [Withania somnifera]
MVNAITRSTSACNNHVMIEFLLIILADVPKDVICREKLFALLVRVVALTKEVFVLVRNLEENSRNEESMKETNLKNVFLKAPVGASQLCFPMSDGPLFMTLLLRNLNDLLNSNAYSVALIKEEIGRVKEDLELIRSFFGNVEQELHRDLWSCVLDVAYEAEHAIHSILTRDHGFEEETEWIIRKLTSGPTERDVISIVGMPGLGKTTLAYKVYNHKAVVGHFDIRAWCTVDQERNKKKLLQKLLNQVIGLKERFNEDDIDEDVADKLRKQLFGKRYLIVLDDLWDTATWDEQTRPFPSEFQKGSRVILTSRKREVALHGKCRSDPLDLRLLKPEESWELLEKREFGEDCCPDELKDVGEKIAQQCDGLPLVLDLIGGVISRKEKKKASWLEVLNNLNSFIFKDEEEVMKVMQLSYDHLSDHLKPCFLYLARYPKDKDIWFSELKNLWSSEGLVEPTDLKSVGRVMEVYVNELICISNILLSPSVWSLAKLRHLFSNDCSVFVSDIDKPTKLEHPRNLRNLKLPSSVDSKDIFKRFPNLEALKFEMDCSAVEQISFPRLDDLDKLESVLQTLKFEMDCSAAEQISFPRLDILDKLESVDAKFKCSGCRTHVHQFDFHFPGSLKEVKLEKFNLTSDALSRIGKSLPNLQKLNLKYLFLHEMSFSEWQVIADESFPVLEVLHIYNCDGLKEISESFRDIASLKLIETSMWEFQLKKSALKIKEYVEEMTGEDKLQLSAYES